MFSSTTNVTFYNQNVAIYFFNSCSSIFMPWLVASGYTCKLCAIVCGVQSSLTWLRVRHTIIFAVSTLLRTHSIIWELLFVTRNIPNCLEFHIAHLFTVLDVLFVSFRGNLWLRCIYSMLLLYRSSANFSQRTPCYVHQFCGLCLSCEYQIGWWRQCGRVIS